jgi:hypothetical protein
MVAAFTEIKGATWASTDTLENIRNELVVVDTVADAILVDTNELQTDWANGGRLDLLLDAASSAGLKVETLASAGVASAGGSVSGPVAMECVALSVTDGEARRSQRRMLDRDEISTRILVLNALYDVGTLQRIAGEGRELGATHVVFTHLDELTQWGRLWELLVEGELSPLFLSTGPSAVGSREDDVVAAVLRRTVPGAGGA